ncbi:MAG TPA: carboxypeptidase regulatory-like domain-containing protein, partial [Gemmatimonadaceae bacterium]
MHATIPLRLRIAALALLVAAQLNAQDTILVTVRGLAFDSLRDVPLSGAFIALGGTSRTTQSDARGRFTFDSVPAGRHVIQMQHDILDSIGFAGRSARVAVDATHRDVVVAVPSFATLWRGLCGGPAPRDSGIVYGMVHDVAGNPKVGAMVGITWQDASVVKRRNIELKDVGGRVSTDSTGRYVFCGVPIDVGFQLAASADAMITGAVDVAPLSLRISR